MTENDVAKVVVDAALKVHRALGPGLLESTYMPCEQYEQRLSMELLRTCARVLYENNEGPVRLRDPVPPCETVSSGDSVSSTLSDSRRSSSECS